MPEIRLIVTDDEAKKIDAKAALDLRDRGQYALYLLLKESGCWPRPKATSKVAEQGHQWESSGYGSGRLECARRRSSYGWRCRG